jgi:GNAT superfamily N-acetyltransferase
MRTFYDSLSDTAAYYRFLGLRPAMLDAEVQHSVDQSCRHICLLARLEDGRLIGIGEYSVSGPATAEVAIAVADDHHHEGVATLLLERLVEVARRCGLERFMARTMRGNEEMRHVLRTLGLRDHVEHDDGTVTYSLDLGSYDELQRQSTARLEQALRAASHLLRPQAADDGGS